MAGFSPEQVAFILTSPLPAAVLGRRYGCSHQAICDVRNNKTYRKIRPDLPRFNKYSTRRLDPQQVLFIRESKDSLNDLAERFNVSRRTILAAKRGETYRHIEKFLTPESDAMHCFNCIHWASGCDLGFPEALEDPTSAADCTLFKPEPSKS